MRVLLTNDDGIHAAGLKALYQELKRDFEVHIVAPDSEMSAVGHAITLTSRNLYSEENKIILFELGLFHTLNGNIKIELDDYGYGSPVLNTW